MIICGNYSILLKSIQYYSFVSLLSTPGALARYRGCLAPSPPLFAAARFASSAGRMCQKFTTIANRQICSSAQVWCSERLPIVPNVAKLAKLPKFGNTQAQCPQGADRGPGRRCPHCRSVNRFLAAERAGHQAIDEAKGSALRTRMNNIELFNIIE